MTDDLKARLLRPIVGIENRTAQEVFDIMSDRIRSARIEALEADNARLRTALDWTLSEIDGRTRYDHHEQRDNCIALARAALVGAGNAEA